MGMGNMDKLQVRLFGSTTVNLPDGTVVTDFGGIKPRQILEILAISVGTPVAKERLADLLWDGNPPRTYIGTLESYVSLVRRRLALTGGRRSALASTTFGYVLDAGLVTVDLDETRRAWRSTALVSTDTRLRAEQALMDSPELLVSEPYADWASRERMVFQAEHVLACRRAGEHALAGERPETGIELARRAIASDPMSESSWQLLMRSLNAAGAHTEALRAYADLRNRTVEELGSEPGPATQRLYLEILQHDGHGTQASSSTQEVRALLRLLKGALESFPGVELAYDDRRMLRTAERLAGVA
jgi:DNA-binding SARP family transcriptional activator